MLQSFNTLRRAAAFLAFTTIPLAASAQVLEYVGSVSDSITSASTTVSPHITTDGEHFYIVVAQGSVQGLAHYSRNNVTGELSFIAQYNHDIANGFFPSHTPITTRNGLFMYSANAINDAISVLSRNTTTGTISLLENHFDGQNGVDGLDAACDITISPDEKNIYVVASTDDAVTVFDRDTTTGLLTFRETFKNNVGGVTGLNNCRLIKVSPNGQFVYAIGRDDDAVVTFSRNTTTGALTFVSAYTIPYTQTAVPTSFDISNDGAFAVVAGSGDSSVHILSLHQTTGEPSAFQVIKEGVNGLSGVLYGAINSVRFSPDFTYLYVATTRNNSPVLGRLLVFVHSSTDNTFSIIENKTLNSTIQERYQEGAIVSHDSKFIYNMQATGTGGNSQFSIQIHKDTTTRIIISVEQLGVQQETKITNMYPNPSKGAVYFDCPSINDGTALRLRLVDVLGRELYNQELIVSGGRLEADFSALPRGAYYVQLSNKTVALRLD